MLGSFGDEAVAIIAARSERSSGISACTDLRKGPGVYNATDSIGQRLPGWEAMQCMHPCEQPTQLCLSLPQCKHATRNRCASVVRMRLIVLSEVAIGDLARLSSMLQEGL